MTEVSQEEFGAIVGALASTEAGRRVGWAKYYESDAEADKVKAIAAHRMGLIAGFARLGLEKRLSVALLADAIEGFVDQCLVDPFPRASYEQGKLDVEAFLQERFGGIVTSRRVLKRLATHMFGKVMRHRCENCAKLVCEEVDGALELRCPRCKEMVKLKASPEQP